MQQTDKLAIELATAFDSLLTFSPEKYASWQGTRAGHRFMAFLGRKVAAVKIVNGKPQRVNGWEMTAVKADLEQGFLSQWVDDNGKTCTVGHTPVELHDGCFMWHNHSSGYEFTKRYGDWSLRLSMTIRTQSNPRGLVEGVTYLTEESKLDQLGLQ